MLMAFNLPTSPAGMLPTDQDTKGGAFAPEGPSHNAPLYEAATFAPFLISTFRAILLSD